MEFHYRKLQREATVAPPIGGENQLAGKVKQQNGMTSAQYVFQQTIFNLSDILLQQFTSSEIIGLLAPSCKLLGSASMYSASLYSVRFSPR